MEISEKVLSLFQSYELEDRIVVFEKEASATVALAAKAIGCQEAEIAKTIALANGENTIMVVAAGDRKIDNKKFRDTFGIKAKMLPFQEVLPRTGYNVGGVCPFSAGETVSIYLDVSLKRFDYVYPACGTSNSAAKLSLDELAMLAKTNDWVDVCKTY